MKLVITRGLAHLTRLLQPKKAAVKRALKRMNYYFYLYYNSYHTSYYGALNRKVMYLVYKM